MTGEADGSRIDLNKEVLCLNGDGFERVLEQALALSNKEGSSHEVSEKEVTMNAELIQIIVRVGLIGRMNEMHTRRSFFTADFEEKSVEDESLRVCVLQSLRLIERTISRIPKVLDVVVEGSRDRLISWLIWRMAFLLRYDKMDLLRRSIYEIYILITCTSSFFAREALDAVKNFVKGRNYTSI